MTKKLEELLNLPESQDILKEEKEKAQAEEKKQENKSRQSKEICRKADENTTSYDSINL